MLDLYDQAHVAGWKPYNLHDLEHMFPGREMCSTDPSRDPIMACEDPDDLDRDLPDV